MYFWHIEDFVHEEINERSFGNPHPINTVSVPQFYHQYAVQMTSLDNLL